MTHTKTPSGLKEKIVKIPFYGKTVVILIPLASLSVSQSRVVFCWRFVARSQNRSTLFSRHFDVPIVSVFCGRFKDLFVSKRLLLMMLHEFNITSSFFCLCGRIFDLETFSLFVCCRYFCHCCHLLCHTNERLRLDHEDN